MSGPARVSVMGLSNEITEDLRFAVDILSLFAPTASH